MARLLALFGPKRGVRIDLDGKLVVGRASSADLQLVDEKISREHCRFSQAGAGVVVEDLGSQNGTFVNGVRITAAAILHAGDEIAVGDSLFVVDTDDGADLLTARFGEDAIWLSGVDTLAAGTAVDPRAAGQWAARADAFVRLRDCVAALAASRDQEAAAGAALAAIENGFSPEHAFVLVAGRHGVTPLAGKSRGATVPIARALLSLAVAADGKIRDPDGILFEDAGAEAALKVSRSVARHGLRSVMVAPIRRAGQVVGFLHVDRDGKGALSAADLDLLAAIAGAIGGHGLHGAFSGDVKTGPPGSAGAAPIMDGDPIGSAPAFKAAIRLARAAANSDATVLITGETGTGKEEIARLVHRAGAQAGGPFVAVNCGAIPPELIASELFGHERGAFTGADRTRIGFVEEAAGGSLFLDEIGDLPPPLQVQLLRVLQERVFIRVGSTVARRMNARVITATHRDLAADVTAGRFRQDLFFRINVIAIALPPLRQRREDIAALAEGLLYRLSRRLGRPVPALSPTAIAALSRWPFPGNVRELGNVLERMVVLRPAEDNGPIDVDDVNAALGRPMTDTAADRGTPGGSALLSDKVAALERTEIEAAMRLARGVKSQAARALGISRPTLDKKLVEHTIDIWKTADPS